MNKHIGAVLLHLVFVTSAVKPLRAQSATEHPRFEVTSVRVNVSRNGTGRMTAEGDRFTASCVPLLTIVRWAFRPPNRVPIFYDPNLVIGLPGWATGDCFDVQARAETAVPVEQLERMVQAMLEDRFQLKAHRETREASIYHLVVAGGQAKMKLSEDQTPPGRPKPVTDPSAPPQRGVTDLNIMPTGGRMKVTLTGTGIAMDQLANRFQGLVGRSVIDKTGLTELFDIDVQAFFDAPEAPTTAGPNEQPAQAATPGPPQWIEVLVFKAIQDQLGLKLENAKGTNQVLVIDNVQKPSEN